MRVAILIHGAPRFCKEFDYFLEKFIGYDQADWFFYLWKDNNLTSDLLVGRESYNLIPPPWKNIKFEWAIEKLKEYLPPNNYIAGFSLGNQYAIKHPEINLPIDSFAKSNQRNVWKMWYSLFKANQMKVRYENGLDFKYDLVIRARPDVGLANILDARTIKNHVDSSPGLILMPENHVCGYGVNVCDMFGVGNSEDMDIYCDLYNQALLHCARGLIFHPETLLGHHLTHNRLFYGYAKLRITNRVLGEWEDPVTGVRYFTNQLSNTDRYHYISDFGRWEDY